MKIVGHKMWAETEHGFNISRHVYGGSNDGQMWYAVEVEFEDGTKVGAWICDQLPGYFRQVFVPLEFHHESVFG